jgi:O-antigen ligase
MNKSNVKMVVFSLLSSAKLSFVGTLILSEVYAMFYSFSFKRIRNLYDNVPDMRKIHIAMGLFLGVQMLSDVINHTSTNNMLRGWAALTVAIVMFTFMFRMFDETPKVIVAFMIAEVVRLILFGQSNLEQDTTSLTESYSAFKFRIAPITNNIVLLLVYYFYNKRKDGLAIAMFILYGLLCIGLDYRSNGLFYLFAGLIVMFRKQLMNMSLARKLGLTIFGVVIFQVLFMLYVSAVLSGQFGGSHAGEQLAETGNPYNPFSLISQGRGEFFVAIEAIKDAPILGHGSWAEDKDNHYRMMLFKDVDVNKTKEEMRANGGVIPSHSVLLGAWLYAGFIGFFAMLYIFILVLKRAFSLIKDPRAMETPYYPLIVLYTVQLIWTFPFSPLPQIRNIIPVFISFIITIYYSLQNEEEDEEEDLLPDNG